MPSIHVVILALVLGISGASAIAEPRLRVALDPGHGGADPGALAREVNEAELVLAFAKRLSALLIETGRFDVVLTRERDETVPLDKRLTRARKSGAEVFLSLHADSLAPGDGQATGLTVYTLDDTDIENADTRLTERHDGTDILTGMDLSDSAEDVSQALIAISRQEAQPRSHALAETLLSTFAVVDVDVNRRPHRHGGFAVLKAADMPSVLIELGFLSNARDLERLASDDWLQSAALAIRDGLLLWQLEDRVFREQTWR